MSGVHGQMSQEMNEEMPSQGRGETSLDTNDIAMAEPLDADMGESDPSPEDDPEGSSSTDSGSQPSRSSRSSNSRDPGCCGQSITNIARIVGRGSPARPVLPGAAIAGGATDALMSEPKDATADAPPAQAAKRADPTEEPPEAKRSDMIIYEKSKGFDTYSVNGHTVGGIIKEIFKDDFQEVPQHDLSCIWNLISNFARFDFEWRVSSPLSWNIEDNMVKRVVGPLDTSSTKYAAVTLNFDTEVVDQMELCLKLKTNAGHEKSSQAQATTPGYFHTNTGGSDSRCSALKTLDKKPQINASPSSLGTPGLFPNTPAPAARRKPLRVDPRADF